MLRARRSRAVVLAGLFVVSSTPVSAAFPPTLEISGRIVDPSGTRALSDVLPPAFLSDLETDESSFEIQLRASDHPDSTAETSITVETHFSTEGSSAACGGAAVRLGIELEFEVLEHTDVVEHKGASDPVPYRETEAHFVHETRAGGTPNGCLAAGDHRDETWTPASIERRVDEDGSVTDDSTGFPPGQRAPVFVPVPTGDEKLYRRYPRHLAARDERHVATFGQEYVHPGGDESEGWVRVHLDVGAAIGFSSQGAVVREVTESVVEVRVTIRKFVDAQGPVSRASTSFGELKARYDRR